VDSNAIYNGVKRFDSRKEITVGLKCGSELQLLPKKNGLLIVVKEEIPTKKKSIRSITDTFIYL